MTIQCSRQAPEVIARINTVNIDTQQFSKRYSEFLSFSGQKDNLLNRKEYIQAMIDEELLVETARKKKWTQSAEWQTVFNRQKDQALLNALYATDVKPKLKPEDRELRTLYKWSKEKLHVRHLFSRSRESIDSLAGLLKSGADWDSLAKNTFSDSVLASNGGDLGWVSLGDLDPPFEKVAFTLSDGEISYPVQTSTGYSIIQIIERKEDPFLLESDFRIQQKKLEQIGHNYLKGPEVRKYTDHVADELGLAFYKDAIHKLLNTELPSGSTAELALTDSKEVCVRIGSQNRTLSIAETADLLRTLSPRQIRLITSDKTLKSVLTGILVRQELLKRSEALGLDKADEFQNNLSKIQRNYIVRQSYHKITDMDVSSNTDSLLYWQRKRYMSFRDSLRTKSQVHVNESLLRSMKLSLN